MTYGFQFGAVWAAWGELAWGAWLTLRLSAGAMVLGLALAVACAAARGLGPRWAGALVGVYVEAIRNTPLLVQVFLVFFGGPAIGLRLDATLAALAAMTLNVGAYAAEILRAGIETVPRGQVEAGLALGLRPFAVFRRVVLFQALKATFPALGSQFILILLASSITSTIAAEELTAVANSVQSRTFRSFEVYLVVTGVYLCMALAFSGLFALIESRVFGRQDRARAPAGAGP